MASTYGGNPMCAMAALATIEFHRRHRLGERSTLRGCELDAALENIAASFPDLFEQARGLGLMRGLPLRGEDSIAAAARCDALLEGLKDRGILAGTSGPDRNVLTFMPPLVISADDIRRVHEVLAAEATRILRKHRGCALVGKRYPDGLIA
jgi:4-aminobutyrate aminotransferase